MNSLIFEVYVVIILNLPTYLNENYECNFDQRGLRGQ